MKAKITVEIVCLMFIILFVYASVSKLVDYEQFRVQLGQSPLLTGFAGIVAWSIPVVEIIISIMLAIPVLRVIGLFSSFTLMVMFTNYIVVITQFADYVPCSCGGVLQNLGWTEHLFFNIGFVLLAAMAITLSVKENKQIEPDRFNEDKSVAAL